MSFEGNRCIRVYEFNINVYSYPYRSEKPHKNKIRLQVIMADFLIKNLIKKLKCFHECEIYITNKSIMSH